MPENDDYLCGLSEVDKAADSKGNTALILRLSITAASLLLVAALILLVVHSALQGN